MIRLFRKSNFKCAEFDEDEENLLFLLICIRFGTFVVRRLKLALKRDSVVLGIPFIHINLSRHFVFFSPYFQQIFRSVFTNYTTEMKQSNAYWLSVYQPCFVSYLTFVLSETKETFTSPASAMLSGKESCLIRPSSPNTEIRAARFQSIRDLEAKWPTVQESLERSASW